MARVQVSNVYLKTQLTNSCIYLNFQCSIRLFFNNFFPNAASTVMDFAEPTFTGYARQSLLTAFPPPLKVYDGLYESRAGPVTFTSADAAEQKIFGWFVADAANVQLMYRFDAPFLIKAGHPLTITMVLQDGDNSLLCP